MKNLSFLIILSFSAILAKAQGRESFGDVEYMNQTRKFLFDVFGQRLTSTKFVLINEPKFNCELKYSDTSFFNSAELIDIKNEINRPKIKYWPSLDGLNVNYISNDSLNIIFKKEFLRLYNGWDYFHKYLGKEANSFSSPIFIRNYQYCIFYSEYVCDFKCGYGETALYKREKGKWIKLKSICSWIS